MRFILLLALLVRCSALTLRLLVLRSRACANISKAHDVRSPVAGLLVTYHYIRADLVT